MSAWIHVYHERRFCHLRPELGLPNRSVREVIPPIDKDEYKYLRMCNMRASNGYCTVIRGLEVGVFSSW